MNIDLALQLAAQMARAGVEELCICAGARNSPLVTVFSELSRFRLYHFFEERSAAFFALGRIKARAKPVAVVTTSGTAVAELLPATMESYYTGAPLLLLTADRPRRYRGTGAPQAVEQVGIFGPYVKFATDLAAGESVDLRRWDQTGPAHLNVCFEEPLLDRPVKSEDLRSVIEASEKCEEIPPASALYSAPEEATEEATPKVTPKATQEPMETVKLHRELDRFLERVRRPLVIIGGLNGVDGELRKALTKFLLGLGAPVYAEATSGLREIPELAPIRVHSTDRLFERLGTFRYPVDGVLRIGGVPTLRFWRDLESKRADLPVLSISDCAFAGSARSELLVTPLTPFFARYEPKHQVDPEVFADFFAADQALYRDLLELLRQEPTSECGIFHALSKLIPFSSRVYLGNSLPIREWDLAASREERRFVFGANRGANGIDGQISSFFGFSESNQENWGIIGDLTAMYDLSAPWILPQLSDLKVKLVVMNNGGGKIFSRMFQNPVFQNRHELGFGPWAEFWKMGYELWERVPAAVSSGSSVIELRPDPVATSRFWEAYDRLCQSR